jgi:hypothetical protein
MLQGLSLSNKLLYTLLTIKGKYQIIGALRMSTLIIYLDNREKVNSLKFVKITC